MGFQIPSVVMPSLMFCAITFSVNLCIFGYQKLRDYLEKRRHERVAETIENDLIIHEWQREGDDKVKGNISDAATNDDNNDNDTTTSKKLESDEENNMLPSNPSDQKKMKKNLITKLSGQLKQERIKKKREEEKEFGHENNKDDDNDNDDNDDDDISFFDVMGEVNGSNLGCAICIKSFQTGDLVCQSNNDQCQHMFHKECIFLWLKKQNTCPLCKETFALFTV